MDDGSQPGATRIEELFRAHAVTILGYARGRLPRQDAEDVVSETFAAAWRRIDDIPDPALPWLLKTARNKIGDRIRAAHRLSALARRLEYTVGWRHDPTERIGESQRIQRALDRLRPSDRDVVELLVAADVTHAELAAILGCSENTAYVRCHRARQRLAAALKAEDGSTAPRPATATPALTID